MESRLLGFPCFPYSVISNGLLWKRVSQNHNHREGHADRTASSDSQRTVLVQDMLSTSTLSWGLRDGPAFALRSVARA